MVDSKDNRTIPEIREELIALVIVGHIQSIVV